MPIISSKSDVEKLKREIRFNIKDSSESENGVVLVAYLLYLKSQTNNPFSSKYSELLKEYKDLAPMIKKYLDENAWECILELLKTYHEETLKDAIFGDDDLKWNAYSTPSSVNRIAAKLLDLKETDTIADICCGRGDFLNTVADGNKYNLYGCDFNFDAINIAKIRSNVLNSLVKYEVRNVFELPDKNYKFNKIFCNFPFGLRFVGDETIDKFANKVKENNPRILRHGFSDWLYVLLTLELLNEQGTAVTIINHGYSSNSYDTEMRKYLVENKLIKAVIMLPENVFNGTFIRTDMLVLGKNDKEGLQIVDATNVFEKNNNSRIKTISDENINIILESLENDTEISKLISYAQLEENEYIFNLNKYQFNELDGVKFGDVIKRITRGAPITSKQLEDIQSEEKTDIKFLRLANIRNDGLVDYDMPYLKSIDKNFERYLIKNNSLVLSKNSYPYKVAVIEVTEDENILANGNLYVIELDENQANPYYVKCFFESNMGNAALKSITRGNILTNIGVEDLKSIKIPLPSIEDQRKFVDKYLAKVDEIELYELKANKAREELKNMFNNKED